MEGKTCCFTGHRSQKLPWGFKEGDEKCKIMKCHLKEEILKAIDQGYTHFISGMALGFDIISAELVLELKSVYSYITLECALPCKTQHLRWPSFYRSRYINILENADSIWCKHEYYEEGCMQERNEYMVDSSSLVIALYNGKPGGTRKTIEYARKKGKEVVIIPLL